MKRKDGQPKIRSKRNLPEFSCGFRAGQGKSKDKKVSTFDVVSLFAGCGGLDLGFEGGFSFLGREYERLPFQTIAAYDNSADAVETYRLNLGDEAQEADLATIDISTLPKTDVLTGGFPCQDFSSSGPKVGLNGARGQLYTVLRDYMKLNRPKIVIGENVPHLKRMNQGEYLRKIITDFADCGYRILVWELFGPDYGLPQSRRRIIIVGVRDDLDGFPIKPKPLNLNRHVSVDQGIEDLALITDESIANQSQFFMASRATSGGGQGDHSNQRGKVAYCIRANARGRIQFHYDLDRRLTVRECARLQSFPDGFVFPYTTQRNMTLIGNAVPPILGHAVAKSIAAYLDGSAVAALGTTDFSNPTQQVQESFAL